MRTAEAERARMGMRPDPRPNPGPERQTHGRHCPCTPCCRQDWSEPELAPCGMHGEDCPPVYDPYERSVESKPVGLLVSPLGEGNGVTSVVYACPYGCGVAVVDLPAHVAWHERRKP